MKISACIIAKDEEKNLPRLLDSIKGKFDEIILVDTGSQDRTVDIAKKYGCKVVKHEWSGFADARNRAIAEATGDWIWHFDADFELEEEEYKKALVYIKKFFNNTDGFLIGVKNLDKNGKVKSISSHIFIHKNKPDIKWIGKIHETPNINFALGIPVYVKHYGYADITVQLKKAKRNLKLLLDEIKEYKTKDKLYAIKLFYLVQTFSILSYEDSSYLEDAKKYALEFLTLTKGDNSLRFFKIYIYNYLLGILRQLEEKDLYEKYLKEALSYNWKIPDFYVYAFNFYYDKKDYFRALESLEKLGLLLDEIERNPFVDGVAFASEKVREFEKIILDLNFGRKFMPPEILEKFRRGLLNSWKIRKGKNISLLLAVISAENEKLKILRKLVRRFSQEDLIIYLFLMTLLNVKGEEAFIREAVNFEGLPIYDLLMAKFYENSNNQKDALKHYLKYLQRTQDKITADYLLSNYSDLKREFAKRYKKNLPSSDNL